MMFDVTNSSTGCPNKFWIEIKHKSYKNHERQKKNYESLFTF